MCHEAASHPPGYGWQPSLLYNQHFGLPPFLDFRDLSWMESIFRKLRTSSWSGYTQASGIAPKFHRELCGGVSEVLAQQSRWTVSLDVNHFAPSEIIVRTQSGFLEIEGQCERFLRIIHFFFMNESMIVVIFSPQENTMRDKTSMVTFPGLSLGSTSES